MNIVHETSRQRKQHARKTPLKDRPAWLVDAVRNGTKPDWSIALGYASNRVGGFEAFQTDMMDVQNAAGAACRARTDPYAYLNARWTWARQIVREHPSRDMRGVVREDVAGIIASHASYVPSGDATEFTTAKTIRRVLHVLDERASVVGPDVAMGCRQIAELAGCSRMSAGRALQALEADGIIQKTGKAGMGKKATPYVLCAETDRLGHLPLGKADGRESGRTALRKDYALAYGQRREDVDQDQVQTSELRTSASALAPTTSVYVKNNTKYQTLHQSAKLTTFDGSTDGRVHAAITACGTAGDDGLVESPLDAASMARQLGVSARTVRRALRRLRDAGGVEKAGRSAWRVSTATRDELSAKLGYTELGKRQHDRHKAERKDYANIMATPRKAVFDPWTSSADPVGACAYDCVATRRKSMDCPVHGMHAAYYATRHGKAVLRQREEQASSRVADTWEHSLGPCEHGCEADGTWRDECPVHGPRPIKTIVGDCGSGCATSQKADQRCNVHGFYLFRDEEHRTA